MELKTFDFNGLVLRAFVKNTEPWFIAKDLCEVLGTNPKDIPSLLDKEDYKPSIAIEGYNKIKGLRKDTRLVSEPGMYSLILKSPKPEALAFKK